MTLREAFEKLRMAHNAAISYGPVSSAPTDVAFFFEAISVVCETAAQRTPPLTQTQINMVIENASVTDEEFIVMKEDSEGKVVGAKVYIGRKFRANLTLDNSHFGFLQKGNSVRVVNGAHYKVNTATEKRVTLLRLEVAR